MSNYSFTDDVNKKLAEELARVAKEQGLTENELLEIAAKNLAELRKMMDPIPANSNRFPTVV